MDLGTPHGSPVVLALCACAYLASVRATQHDLLPLPLARQQDMPAGPPRARYTEPAYTYDTLYMLLDYPLDVYGHAYSDVLKVIPTSAAALSLAAGLEPS